MGFILNSWLRSYRSTLREVPKETYFEAQEKAIRFLLSLPEVEILVATSPDDIEQILSYAVIERENSGDVIHWAYTKAPFRRMGLLKFLLKEGDLTPKTYTHKSWITPRLAQKYKLTFNPFLR